LEGEGERFGEICKWGWRRIWRRGFGEGVGGGLGGGSWRGAWGSGMEKKLECDGLNKGSDERIYGESWRFRVLERRGRGRGDWRSIGERIKSYQTI